MQLNVNVSLKIANKKSGKSISKRFYFYFALTVEKNMPEV